MGSSGDRFDAASTAVFIAVLVAAFLTIAGGLAMPRAHVDDVEHRPVGETASS